MLENDFIFFEDRVQRAGFIKDKFNKYIDESASILDVGCANNELKKLIGDKVFGIDIAGKPDKVIDLEKEALSFFPDNSFDLVICTEVIEHIDNLHEIINEMTRVSRKYILVSAPNCPDVHKILRIAFTADTGKFYGLPGERPSDRHKWFFSWKELDRFFENYCFKKNLGISWRFVHFNYSDTISQRLLKNFLKIVPLRIFSQSYWILIEK